MKDFLDIAKDLKKLDGLEVGSLQMSSEQILHEGDRPAVIDAAAKNIEQKIENSADLEMLLEKFNVNNEEIINQIIIRHLDEVLG